MHHHLSFLFIAGSLSLAHLAFRVSVSLCVCPFLSVSVFLFPPLSLLPSPPYFAASFHTDPPTLSLIWSRTNSQGLGPRDKNGCEAKDRGEGVSMGAVRAGDKGGQDGLVASGRRASGAGGKRGGSRGEGVGKAREFDVEVMTRYPVP